MWVGRLGDEHAARTKLINRQREKLLKLLVPQMLDQLSGKERADRIRRLARQIVREVRLFNAMTFLPTSLDHAGVDVDAERFIS